MTALDTNPDPDCLVKLRSLMRTVITVHGGSLSGESLEFFKKLVASEPDRDELIWAFLCKHFDREYRELFLAVRRMMIDEGFVMAKAAIPETPKDHLALADARTGTDTVSVAGEDLKADIAAEGAEEGKGADKPRPSWWPPQKPSRKTYAGIAEISGRVGISRLLSFTQIHGVPLCDVTLGAARKWVRDTSADVRFVKMLIAPMTDVNQPIGDYYKNSEAEIERVYRMVYKFKDTA